MGYACPVCADPQADAGHLANHLAFSAMLGDADHEEWLDDHAPGWGEMGESDLADVVADDVAEAEFPQVFEDTTGTPSSAGDPLEERSGVLFDEGHDHGGRGRDRSGHASDDRGRPEEGQDPVGVVDTGGELDDETAAAVEAAREMTREMLADDDEEPGAGDGADSDAEDDTGTDAAGGTETDAEDDTGTDAADGAEADAEGGDE